MTRGVFATGETKRDAAQQVREAAPQMRILRSRPISLAGLPPLRNPGPLDHPWVVVVEHEDPAEEAKLPQDKDPEGTVERSTRELYLNLATDPDALITGVREGFDCPACAVRIEIELPPPREVRFENHTTCPACEVFLVRAKDELRWRVAGSRATPVPECAFCDRPGNSLEHVIPDWLSKRLGITAEIPAEVAFRVRARRRRKQAIPFGGYRAPVMCAPCNEHFGRLEEVVIRLLEPMAKGRRLVLAQESQQLLALWANKTAISLLAAEDPTTVPKAQGKTVRGEARVANGTWVGFFPWRDDPVLSTNASAFVSTAPRPVDAYGALLAFGAVGFVVFGIRSATAVPRILTGEPPPLRTVLAAASRDGRVASGAASRQHVGIRAAPVRAITLMLRCSANAGRIGRSNRRPVGLSSPVAVGLDQLLR